MALVEELERSSIIIACWKKKCILQLVHISMYTVSELCSLYIATLTHPWMGTQLTDPQPCKHVLKWSLTVHTLLGARHASLHGRGLTLIDLPPTYSLV